jgi:ribosomal-protein-alanine N-acetyltransferase
MKLVKETQRLLLREFTEADHLFIIQLLNSEGWLQYIGNRNITNKEEAVGYINNALRTSYVNNGYGLYLVEIKESNIPAGMCGFVKRDALPVADLGFAFLPEYSGNGFAYESAGAALHYGFGNLKFDKIAGVTMLANGKSINLLKKLGFNDEGEIAINNEQLKLFGITKNEYELK